jgi:outer membrane protein
MTKLYARAVLAMVLATLVAFGPVSPASAQDPPAQAPQNPPIGQQDPDKTKNEVAVPPPAAPQPQAPAIPVALGLGKHDYSYGPRAFPTLLAPYRPIPIEHPELSNSPRIDQLIHDGKLQITLQDAVELSLENSLDIVIQRYTPWLADTDILLAKSGGSPRGFLSVAAVPGSVASDVVASSANLPILNLDPVLTGSVSIFDGNEPINNPFTSGTGATGEESALIAEKIHSSAFNFGYAQAFTSGTSVSATWDNTRGSTSPTANLFNPSVASTLTATISQQLLNGCCFEVNRRNIIIAKNNRKIADLVFMQQAITTVTNTITAYWELVYARENVKVEQQAVAVSQKLYNDNKKQLEIGTMAPLDVTRAESELASDQGNLLVAQTTQLQDEQVLKNAISKNPLATNLINVEIIPTDLPSRPENIEAASFEDAIKEAFTKRPDVLQEVYNLKNADVDVKATANALLPILTLSGQYTSNGLAGNAPIAGTSVTTIGAGTVPIVDANGNPITITGPGGVQVPIFEPTVTTTTPITGVTHGGFGNAQNQIFRNEFPGYAASLNLTLPLRNRAAQSENARAILTARQVEAQTLQIKNAALLDVRNTFIALEQDRARVDAAVKARQLQQETFDAEQKKYALGASTVYLVIQTQRDLVTAQGTELRALADLVEAKANYERAVGRTLETNRVTIAGNQQFEHDTLIPGTRDGKVIGTDKLFSNPGTAEGQK